jgi:outer membrane receptor for ferrienterochelin and colicin
VRLLSLAVAASATLQAVAAFGQDRPAREGARKPPQDGQTITVTAQPSATTRTPESTTYDTRNNAQGQAGTAADVLNTLPSVSVSGDGGVTVRGNANVQVYVNGKPAASMQGESRATTLQAMSGGSIAGVEVITNPSARYDSNGGAIVNLILKTSASEGLHGSVSGNAGDHRRANLSGSGSVGAGALSGSLNVSVRDDVRLTDTVSDRQLLSGGGTVVGRNFRSARYTPTHARSFNLNGSAAYKLTSSSDLGADFSVERGSPRNRVFEHRIDYDPNDRVVADYDRVRSGTYVSGSFDASVYYQDRGSAGRGSLKIVAQTGGNSIRADRPFVTTHAFPVLAPSAERIFNRYESRQRRLAIDYERPLGARWRLSLGSELKRDSIRLENGRADFAPESLGRLGPPPVGFEFDAVETTAAAYVTVQARFKDWTVQAGERGQVVWVESRTSQGGALRDRRLAGANHSLSISRDRGHAQLAFKLGRSQQYFDPRDLNPLVTIVDPVNRSVGNPGLLPQDVTSVEGSYSFSKGRRDVSASLYYKRVDDTIIEYAAFLPDAVQVSTKQNSGTAQSYGVEGVFADALGKSLTFSVSGNLFHSELPLLEGGRRRVERLHSYSAKLSLDWQATGKDQVRLDGSVQGPTVVPQGVKSGTSAVSLVLRHKFSPDLTLSLTGQNILQRNYVRTVLTTPTAIDVSRSLNGRRAVFVGLRYKIR